MTGLLVVILLLMAPSAFAQTYVAAALGADLTKSYESTTSGTAFPDSDREAIAWGLRVGTTLGSRWGVELEFNRPGTLATRSAANPYAQTGYAPPVALAPVSRGPNSILFGGIYDIFPTTDIETTQRNMTWNTVGWVRQPLGARADLVVLGGLGFSQVVQNTRYNLNAPSQLLALVPIAQRSYRTRTVNYGVGPIVGAEARIRMTEHLELTPGVRAQSLGNDLAQGVLLRPSVALAWTF